MNILIPHSWLLDYLDTKATPKKIAEVLSLCGPTVENFSEKGGKDWIYDIEVTTNRVDMMSVYGIAREAAVILPQFGIKARLKPIKTSRITNKKDLGIKIVNNPKLCKRILAVKLENVNITSSPKWLQERLIRVNQRPLNNVIDITNYITWEIGHPIHAFDYDRIETKKIVVREAKKGEKMITLDNKKHTLNGGEVVFDNGKKEIIDLPGIMGTKNTVVTKNTKNVLLWIESVDPVKIRQASMGLAIRTQAATLNEKHVDPQLGYEAILKAVSYYKQTANAKVASKLVDIYPSPYKPKSVSTNLNYINERLGVNLTKTKIKTILVSLGFGVSWNADKLTTKVPSFRAKDINIPEDIIEEVARIYGYHNFPSNLMSGPLPEKPNNYPFDLELTIKKILSSLGGIEIYTFSLVSKDDVSKNALKLKNPLGKDSEYLRTSLKPSIMQSAANNNSQRDPFHLFEMANIYNSKKNNLPDEIMTVGGIFAHYEYRKAKGIIENLLNQLNIDFHITVSNISNFQEGKHIEFSSNNTTFGHFGICNDNNYIYYEFDVEKLISLQKQVKTFQPIPKYPPQIEDITIKIPPRTKIQEVISSMKETDSLIVKVELGDIYKNSFTFKVWYQHPTKTLTDKEVDIVRNKLLNRIDKKYGAH